MQRRHSRRVSARGRAVFDLANSFFQGSDRRVAVTGINVTRYFAAENLVHLIHRLVRVSSRRVNRSRGWLTRWGFALLSSVNHLRGDIEVVLVRCHICSKMYEKL